MLNSPLHKITQSPHFLLSLYSCTLNSLLTSHPNFSSAAFHSVVNSLLLEALCSWISTAKTLLVSQVNFCLLLLPPLNVFQIHMLLGVCVCLCVCAFSCVQLFATPWTTVLQTPLSMEFFKQEYWTGLPCLLQGIFPTQGSNPGLLHCRWILYQLSSLKVKVAQLFPTLCDFMDYTVHGILQARILEWIAFPFSRRSSQPRDRTQVSHIAGGWILSQLSH